MTIQPLLKQWKEAREVAPVEETAVPTELASAFSSTLAGIWLSATKIANRDLEAVREKAADREAELEEEKSELFAENEALELQMTELKKEMASKAKALVGLEAELIKRQKFLADLGV